MTERLNSQNAKYLIYGATILGLGSLATVGFMALNGNKVNITAGNVVVDLSAAEPQTLPAPEEQAQINSSPRES